MVTTTLHHGDHDQEVLQAHKCTSAQVQPLRKSKEVRLLTSGYKDSNWRGKGVSTRAILPGVSR
eukprot:451491-Pelagomonas_calceolata.AAC.1